LHGRGYSAWEADTIINPDFARRVGLEDRLKSMEIREWSLARTLKEEHSRTLNSGNIPAALERYDKAAAAFAVEPRHPFLDKRLVEFCLGLPAEQKIRRGWTKRILRRAMKNILPEEVRRRCDRVHLNPDFFGSLLAYEKNFLQNAILKDSENIADYVNVAVLNKVYQRYLSSGDPDDAFTVWEVAIFAKWLERIHLVT
jgi:asparagine synthase (glutamine-hydrolysing)